MAIIELNTDANPLYIDTSLFGSNTTLQGAYTNGGAGPQNILLTAAGKGIIVDINGTGVSIPFEVEDSSTSTLFLQVSKTGINTQGPFNLGNAAAGPNEWWFFQSTTAATSTVAQQAPDLMFVGTSFDGAASQTAGYDMMALSRTINVAGYTADLDFTPQRANTFASSPTLRLTWDGTTHKWGFPTATVIASLTQGATNTTGLTINPNVIDGASSIGLVINMQTDMATGKLISLQNNNGTELASILKESNTGIILQSHAGTYKLIIDDTNFGARLQGGTANVTVASSSQIQIQGISPSSNTPAIACTTSINISVAGTSLIKCSANLSAFYFGMATGTANFTATIAEDYTASGSINAGDAVVIAGSDGKTVAQAAASANLTTIAGISVDTVTNGQSLRVIKHGRCIANAEAGITAGTLVGTSGTTAGRVNASTPGAGAIIGRAADATNGNSEGTNKIYVDVNL